MNFARRGLSLIKYEVTGGNHLEGNITISGAKNAAVAILPAALLVKGVCRIENIPQISDVNILLNVLHDLGADIRYINPHTVEIDSSALRNARVPYESARRCRASYYLIGALLGRFGQAEVAMPGGCNFASRPIDQHIKGFAALGADVEETDDYVYLASDASACYHEDKSDLVMREFVWCVPDVFIVFDRIISDQPEYAKKWLYHTAAEPQVKGREFSEESQGGKSICRTLFPNEVRLEKIGGPGKQFWSDGRNWSIPKFTPEDYGYAQRATIPPDDHPLVGQWRMEVSPVGNRKEDIFMHIIQVGDKNLSTLPITSTFDSDSTIGVEFDYNNKHYHIAFDKKAVSNYGCNITVTTK